MKNIKTFENFTKDTVEVGLDLTKLYTNNRVFDSGYIDFKENKELNEEIRKSETDNKGDDIQTEFNESTETI